MRLWLTTSESNRVRALFARSFPRVPVVFLPFTLGKAVAPATYAFASGSLRFTSDVVIHIAIAYCCRYGRVLCRPPLPLRWNFTFITGAIGFSPWRGQRRRGQKPSGSTLIAKWFAARPFRLVRLERQFSSSFRSRARRVSRVFSPWSIDSR